MTGSQTLMLGTITPLLAMSPEPVQMLSLGLKGSDLQASKAWWVISKGIIFYKSIIATKNSHS